MTLGKLLTLGLQLILLFNRRNKTATIFRFEYLLHRVLKRSLYLWTLNIFISWPFVCFLVATVLFYIYFLINYFVFRVVVTNRDPRRTRLLLLVLFSCYIKKARWFSIRLFFLFIFLSFLICYFLINIFINLCKLTC